MPRTRLIVNAVPLTNVVTGVGRYMRCLYTELERDPGLEIHYFDGHGLSREMPRGPENLAAWSLLTELFWKLPPRLGLAVRMVMHARRERRFLRAAQGFDLYHEAGFFPYRAPPGVRTVFTIHDMSIQRHPEHHPRERVLYMNHYLPRRAGWASRYLAVSAFSRDEAVDCLGLDPEAVTVTLLAPEPGFAPRTDAGLRGRLDALGLPGRYFLFVGSGDPRKNAQRIPGALARAGLDDPLAAVGWSGWDQDGGASGVLALGYLPDEALPDVYSGALALVYPSSYEGFGLPVAEAMACGCPVVTARTTSLPEVGGDAALYVDDPANEAELAGVLARVAHDDALRADLAARGLERSRELTWERTARLTRQAFEEALGP